MNPWDMVIWAAAAGCALIVFAFLGAIAYLIIKTAMEKK